MKVTQVAIQPTEASRQAGRPALTPELLAATGARYSRNNEGLEAILQRIDPDNLDRSVDGIFRMIDYGHQSIADMAPVAIFLDGISQWLAYYVWSLCPTAGGQESSTRYLRASGEDLISAEVLGIPEEDRQEWQQLMQECLLAYNQALQIWEETASRDPTVARIPRQLREDASEKAQRQRSRMLRNYGFDRARYYLPAAAATNVMLIMSARGWTQLCQHLLSHPLPEALMLGEAIGEELALAAPRLLKHAAEKSSIRSGINRELKSWTDAAGGFLPPTLAEGSSDSEWPPETQLEVLPAPFTDGGAYKRDLEFHDNRYAWIGPSLRRMLVRFSWDAVAFAEIRDLNRHRTGTRYCPLVPRGFYAALDQWPQSGSTEDRHLLELRSLASVGRRASALAHSRLANGSPEAVYWSLLGTQYRFEHGTTADKFIYEAELRTGAGAHFRYARHLHDALALWFENFPATRGLILEGMAEPE